MAATRNLRPRRAVSKSQIQPSPQAQTAEGTLDNGNHDEHTAGHAIDPIEPHKKQNDEVVNDEQTYSTLQTELSINVDVDGGVGIKPKKRLSQRQPRKAIAKKKTTATTTTTKKKKQQLSPATKAERPTATESTSKAPPASPAPQSHPQPQSSPSTPSLSPEAYRAHMAAVLAGHESELFTFLDQVHKNAIAADTTYLSQLAAPCLPPESSSEPKSFAADPQTSSSSAATHLRLAHAASLQRMTRLYELYTHVNAVIRATRPHRSNANANADTNVLAANPVHSRSRSEELPSDIRLVRSFLQIGRGEAQGKLRAVVATACRR